MITGYKKKKLGHPSEKLSGDVPRASWRAVLFSEVIWPICVASFPQNGRNGTGTIPVNNKPSALIRIAIIAIGPIVWNAAVLMGLFFISLLLGPLMEAWTKFASVMAAIAHTAALVGLIAFFEFF
ncbi:hypothetical protein MPER_02918, partial [Moniliophthora perniciosa FA553]